MVTNAQLFYRYTALDSVHGSFRILSLDPAVNDSNAVRGFLRNEVLSRLTTPFVALSFEWGAPGDCCEIFVDNARFIVQRNLANFLIHVRRSGFREIWIDAICVDQDNLEERGHQVKLMSEIYWQASYVPAYLGEHEDGSQEALQYLQAWVSAGRPEGDQDLQTLHRAIFASAANLPLYAALIKLGQRSY